MARQLAFLGPLHKKFGEEIVFNLGRSLQAKVSSIIYPGEWHWPILRQTPPDFKPNCSRDDYVVWLPHPSHTYSVASAWEAIRSRKQTQPWAPITWSKNFVPRWAFVLWMVVQCKMKTMDRLLSWGMQVDDCCLLWNNEKESYHHFFFQCSISSTIWYNLWGRIPNSGIPNTLLDVMKWYIQNVQRKGFRNLIVRSVLAAAVYGIWMERNLRFFLGKSTGVDIVSLKTVN